MAKFKLLGYDIQIYSKDLWEKAHIHIKHSGREAKYWIDPLALEWNIGYSKKELNAIEKMLSENLSDVLEFWNEQKRKVQ